MIGEWIPFIVLTAALLAGNGAVLFFVRAWIDANTKVTESIPDKINLQVALCREVQRDWAISHFAPKEISDDHEERIDVLECEVGHIKKKMNGSIT